MAASLPSDIIRHILTTWLAADVLILSKLDIAISSRAMRSEYVLVASQINACDRTLGRKGRMDMMVEYLQWVSSRRIRVDLCIELDKVPTALTMLDQHTFPSITKLEFIVDSVGDEDDDDGVESFALFLPKFPNLTKFVGWWTMKDEHLDVVYKMGYPLEHLNLAACLRLSVAKFVELIVSVSSTLVCLSCDDLDNEALLTLSNATFPCLTSLTLDCWPITEAFCVERFCSGIAGRLTNLTLSCSLEEPHSYFDRHLAHAITQMCDKLIEFTFYCKDEEALHCLQPIFSNGPQLLRTVLVGDSNLFEFSTLTKSWEIEVRTEGMDFLQEVLAAVTGPISLIHACGDLNNEVMSLLTSRFGKSIKLTQYEWYFLALIPTTPTVINQDTVTG